MHVYIHAFAKPFPLSRSLTGLFIYTFLFSILLRALLRTSRNEASHEVMFSGLIFKDLLFFYLFRCYVCTFVCMCVGAHRGQKRASDLLELELQAVTGCKLATVGARNQT